MRNRKALELACLVCVVFVAFAFSHACGARGFFPLDQSIVYDGAWRVFQGQIPFKDFVAPIGPVAFLYQALLFKLFGADFASYLLGAALLNAAAAAMVFALVRKSSPGALLLPSGAALTCAVWFQPQIGTTYPDQTAMLLCMAAFFCSLLRWRPEVSLEESGASRANGEDAAASRFTRLLAHLPKNDGNKFDSAAFAAGGIWALAFLAKQNFAVFFLPLLFLSVAFSPPAPKVERLHSFWGGAVAVFAAFAGWLLLFSDWRLFVKHFLAIPIGEGVRRFGGLVGGGTEIRLNAVILFTNMGLFLSSCAVLFSTARKGWAARRGDDSPFLATCALFMITYSYLMITTTNNNPVNSWAFLPLIVGFGFPAAAGLTKGAGKGIRIATRGVGASLALLLILIGASSAWNRRANDFPSGSKFEPLANPPAARPLLWCDQTPAGLTENGRLVVIFKEDVERLARYLADRKAKFFIFPDFAALYGFVGVSSPQPLLWFHKGLTYPAEYDETLDERIVESLRRNNVDTVVLEEYSWFGTAERLNDFPMLKRFISANFAKRERIGIYLIYERR